MQRLGQSVGYSPRILHSRLFFVPRFEITITVPAGCKLMIPHGNGSDSSFSAEAVRATTGPFRRADTPTGLASGGAEQTGGRRSRAGAGGRLKELLQQESKDLRVSRQYCCMSLLRCPAPVNCFMTRSWQSDGARLFVVCVELFKFTPPQLGDSVEFAIFCSCVAWLITLRSTTWACVVMPVNADSRSRGG